MKKIITESELKNIIKENIFKTIGKDSNDVKTRNSRFKSIYHDIHYIDQLILGAMRAISDPSVGTQEGYNYLEQARSIINNLDKRDNGLLDGNDPFTKNYDFGFGKPNDFNLKMNEEQIVYLVCEELKKSDIIDIAKKDKDFEKRIKEIASDVVTDLFRVLWQHNGIFKNLGR